MTTQPTPTSAASRAARLFDLRRNAGLSLYAAAEQVNKYLTDKKRSHSAIARYEKDDSVIINMDVLRALAKAYKTTVDYIEHGSQFLVDRTFKYSGPLDLSKPSASAVQEFADYFRVTSDELIARLPVQPQKSPTRNQIPNVIKQVSSLGITAVARDEQAKYIRRVVDEKAQAAPTIPTGSNKGAPALFEVVGNRMAPGLRDGEWAWTTRLDSVLETVTGKAYIVITQNDGIWTGRVRNTAEKHGFIWVDFDDRSYLSDIIYLTDILEVRAIEGTWRNLV